MQPPLPSPYLPDEALLERGRLSGRIIQEEVALAIEDGDMPMRYKRNGNTLSPRDQILLSRAIVVLAGCGGLGGHVLECLARSGVGMIVACDPDVFEPSNANRQLLASGRAAGRPKALEAQERVFEINPLITVRAVQGPVTSELLAGAHVVADCLGGTADRHELQRMAAAAGLPMVSAGVSGWNALVGSVWPGETGIGEFMSGSSQSSDQLQGVLCPTVAFAASLQAAEVLRILLGTSPALRGSLLLADLAEMRFSTVSLSTR